MAIQTVKDEEAKHSNIDCARANAVEHNIIGNNPFTRRVVPALKGKTVKQQSKMPREDKMNDIPPMIGKEYRDIHLSIDVMFVNGITFLISFSKHICLIQSYVMRKNNKYLDGILAMLRMYRSRHPLRVVNIEADGAFEAIRQELQDNPYQVGLKTYDADRHVESIERQIRFVNRIPVIRNLGAAHLFFN
jgi:hypothetical protein